MPLFPIGGCHLQNDLRYLDILVQDALCDGLLHAVFVDPVIEMVVFDKQITGDGIFGKFLFQKLFGKIRFDFKKFGFFVDIDCCQKSGQIGIGIVACDIQINRIKRRITQEIAESEIEEGAEAKRENERPKQIRTVANQDS